MRFAIAIPQFYADGEFDPSAFRAYLTRAEELGFDSAWTQESVLGPSSQFGPVHLAKSLSTLDQLSRGRIEVGVGTGGKSRPFAAFGVDPQRYVARFSEGLDLMKALWTEPRVTFDGEFWRLSGEAMEPKPFQKPFPPIWIGGAGPAALRRAVRVGSGFFGAGSSRTAAFADQVATVRQALAEAGGAKRDFGIAKRVYIAIDENAGR